MADAPQGAHFELSEVSTARGQQSLGEVPILVWDDSDAARQFYGDQGILRVLNGTSLRVSFQGIARRMKIAGKSDAEIADEQVKFRPGEREIAASTPVSRARKAAEAVAKSGVDGDAIAALLEKVGRGEVSLASLGINSNAAA